MDAETLKRIGARARRDRGYYRDGDDEALERIFRIVLQSHYKVTHFSIEVFSNAVRFWFTVDGKTRVRNIRARYENDDDFKEDETQLMEDIYAALDEYLFKNPDPEAAGKPNIPTISFSYSN